MIPSRAVCARKGAAAGGAGAYLGCELTAGAGRSAMAAAWCPWGARSIGTVGAWLASASALRLTSWICIKEGGASMDMAGAGFAGGAALWPSWGGDGCGLLIRGAAAIFVGGCGSARLNDFCPASSGGIAAWRRGASICGAGRSDAAGEGAAVGAGGCGLSITGAGSNAGGDRVATLLSAGAGFGAAAFGLGKGEDSEAAGGVAAAGLGGQGEGEKSAFTSPLSGLSV
jgi:hypothetical protein